MTLETRAFSRVAVGFSSYEGEFRLPLVLVAGNFTQYFKEQSSVHLCPLPIEALPLEPRSMRYLLELSYQVCYFSNVLFSYKIVVLEKTFESPLDSKEIKPVHPKGNQP